MLQKQNIKHLSTFIDRHFLLLSTFCIIILFVFFQPKVSSLLFSLKRQIVLQTFLHEVMSQGSIDPQKYWEFREFYSPGSFILNKQGMITKESTALEQTVGITQKDGIPVLDFHSGKIMSIDILTTNPVLVDMLHISQKQPIIFQTKNQKIYQQSQQLFIVFALPISEMKKANGFFDYTGDDKKLLQNKYWVNITSVDLR